ncbi:unnamed protein product [Protopolystoma xenopodis]|uniref:Uncharacterized protein n=1 Tax=Protopolystoma xenopodis TaxID=117903 RepID=A0A448WV70_9PLAT|nr:unnamed protein product [Protopolystoma xenopodis]
MHQLPGNTWLIAVMFSPPDALSRTMRYSLDLIKALSQGPPRFNLLATKNHNAEGIVTTSHATISGCHIKTRLLADLFACQRRRLALIRFMISTCLPRLGELAPCRGVGFDVSTNLDSTEVGGVTAGGATAAPSSSSGVSEEDVEGSGGGNIPMHSVERTDELAGDALLLAVFNNLVLQADVAMLQLKQIAASVDNDIEKAAFGGHFDKGQRDAEPGDDLLALAFTGRLPAPSQMPHADSPKGLYYFESLLLDRVLRQLAILEAGQFAGCADERLMAVCISAASGTGASFGQNASHTIGLLAEMLCLLQPMVSHLVPLFSHSIFLPHDCGTHLPFPYTNVYAILFIIIISQLSN